MTLLNNYFLLVLDEEYEDFNNLTIKKNLGDEDLEAIAIILSIDKEKFEFIKKTSSFKKASLSFYKEEIRTNKEFNSLLSTCLLCLNHLGAKELKRRFRPLLEFLRKEGVLAYEKELKMLNVLSLIEDRKKEEFSFIKHDFKEADNFYENALNKIEAIIHNLDAIKKDKTLFHILDKLKNAKFSLGVTGVMNAGKSTMLNALLSKEILGTSMIPETANLTTIKYAKQEKAKIIYWSKKEWERISENKDASVRDFVKLTQRKFGDNFFDFIRENSRVEDIDISKLRDYTSAEHSDLKSNLIRNVELYTDLDFLKDGVEIVDTPGLDDPVVQREEITKEYLANCDMMIHLMNVNQSATQKDLDFILDSLLYRNVSKLLIVFTRIDTVSMEDLAEVILYTKASMRRTLAKYNKDSSFDSIIKKISFLPLAGKSALLHRIARVEEANNLGYSLEKSGIFEIEAYLRDTLFGKNSIKASLIISSSLKDLEDKVKNFISIFNIQKLNLEKSKQDLLSEFKEYEKLKDSNNRLLKRVETEIKAKEEGIKVYFKSLESFAKTKLEYYRDLIQSRLSSELRYGLQNKQKLSAEEIKYMIEIGIKDSILDLISDYKFKFSKKMQKNVEEIEQRYLDIESYNSDGGTLFDFKTFLQKEFNVFLNISNEAFINSILALSSKVSLRNIDEMDLVFEDLFKKFFLLIEDELLLKLFDLNQKLLERFLYIMKKPLASIEEFLSLKEESFTDILSDMDDDEISNKKEILSKKLNILEGELKLIRDLKGSL